MKTIFALLISLFVSTLAYSQVTLSGKIIYKETSLPVEGTTILVKSTDDEIGTFTDKNGFYSVELLEGIEYELLFSTINTNDYYTKIKLKNDSTINVTLRSSSLELEEVSIVGKRRIIQSKIDRLVYHVNHDPLAKSLTTEELMKRIPLLRISPLYS